MGSRPLVYVLRDGRERDGAWASPSACARVPFRSAEEVCACRWCRYRTSHGRGLALLRAGRSARAVCALRGVDGQARACLQYGVGRQARRCSGSAPSRPLCCRACRRAPGRPWNLIAIAPPPPVPVARHPHPSAQLFDTSQFVETRKSTLAGVVWRTKL